MWEKLVNCIKGGGAGGGAQKKGCQVVLLSDLMKQVPPNQQTQFKMFAQKHEEYKARVRKYPESLPEIDWEYYRQNVRTELVDWVNQYQTKYDKLHSLFENRHAIVDHKRYFELVDKESEEVRKEITEYKCASDERIKELSEKLEYLKALQPYNEMTMEEFCYASPHLAPDFINKPTFWPHTPEEQLPGPSDPEAAAALHEEEEPPEPPKKPPPPAPEKAAAEAAPKKPSEPTKDAEAKGSELAEKATAMAKDLVAKATVLLYTLKEKMAALAKNVQKKAEAAKAARAAAAEKSSTPTTAVSEQTLERISNRESGGNVCNQTIIRSKEDEENLEIKAKHSDLSIEADPCGAEEDRIRKKTRDVERRRQKEEAGASICEEICDPCESIEKESICEVESDPCEFKEEELVCEVESDPCELKDEAPVCELESDPCELKDEAPVCEAQPDPCKPQPDPCKPKEDESCKDAEEDHEPGKPKDTKDKGSKSAEPEQVYISIAECSKEVHEKNEKNEKKCEDKPKESASLVPKIEGVDQKTIVGQQVTESKDPKSDGKTTIVGADEIGPVYTDPTQIAQLLTKQKEAKELKVPRTGEIQKPVDDKPVTIYPRREISAKPRVPGEDAEETKKSPEALAKQVCSMASGAASLLSEAADTVDGLKKKKEQRLEVMEQAYISAQRQAEGALEEASKAVNTASMLAQKVRQATGQVSSEDQEALAMAEKHAQLAKMLANRAVALKEDIARVLGALKKKE